jgi:hypothetical protein
MKRRIKIFLAGGTELKEYRNRLLDWHPFRQEAYGWWKKLPCDDPRYDRVEVERSGEVWHVRHSTERGARTQIVLKHGWKVVRVLASYDRRSFNNFCYACIEADLELAKMAGLVARNAAG